MGDGFEISVVPGRGEKVVCKNYYVQKLLKNLNSEISQSSLVKIKSFYRSRFQSQYVSVHI